MPETLLSASTIKLYGRSLAEVTFKISKPVYPAPLGANNFLERQLAAPDAKFAKIYAFSFEGHFYEMPKPAAFLVHGPGIAIVNLPSAPPSALDTTGVISQQWAFSWGVVDTADLCYWEYEKGDFSMRMDLEAGPFEKILLEAVMRGPSGAESRSGMNLRSGMNVRIGDGDPRNGR